MAQGIDLRSNFFAIAIILLRASDMCLLGKWSANRSPPKNRKRIRLNWNKQPWTDSIDSPINHGYIEGHSTYLLPSYIILNASWENWLVFSMAGHPRRKYSRCEYNEKCTVYMRI